MRRRLPVLLAVAAGGAIGSTARYGLSVAVPHRIGELPLATLLVNILGCLLIGAVMATITEVSRPHRLLRPFVGIGILGGFTTFSTYAVEVIEAAEAGAIAMAVLYTLGTVAAAIMATMVGLLATRAILRRTRGEHP